MEFHNDISKTNEAVRDRLRNITVILISSLVSSFVTLYFIMLEREIEKIAFGMIISFSTCVIICIIIWIYLYKEFKRQYKIFSIDVGENYIINKHTNMKLEIDNNCKFTKNKNGYIKIENGKNEITVSKYLNNIIEFENMLLSFRPIIEKEDKYFSNIANWLSSAFFMLLLCLRNINSLNLYLFIGIGFVLTTIYTTAYLIINIKKNCFWSIFSILFNTILVYFVSRNIYQIMEYLIKR